MNDSFPLPPHHADNHIDHLACHRLFAPRRFTLAEGIAKDARIAVLCGGKSSEREVSLRSGKNCLEALHRLGYDHAVLVDVDPYVGHLLLNEGIELAFLALHGEQGEDGAIQGLLEILNIPYTGNGLQASVLTMDKALTKQLLKEAGVAVLPSTVFWWNPDEGGDLALLESLCVETGFPLMVKPVGLGSSVGMSRVEGPEALVDALNLAAEQGSGKILVEPYTEGKDITVGVLQLKTGELKTTPLLEIKPKAAGAWYDFETKYTAGATEFILPAALDETTTQAVQAMALRAHQALGCHGVSRTDFIVTADKRFFVLEVNSIPGMTDLSDLPAQCQAMGMGYDELVDTLLHSAVKG